MKAASNFAIAPLMIASLGAMPLPLKAQATQTDQAASAPSPWPPQIRAEVPYQPTAFPSEGNQHLFYELYLTNFSQSRIGLGSIEVFDPGRPQSPPLARFAGRDLASIVQTIGGDSDHTTATELPAGSTLVAFFEVKIPDGIPVPRQLAHRIVLDNTAVTVGLFHPGRGPLKILGRPVTGAGWLAADGPGSDPDNHHRRGLFLRDGILTDSRRFAIDWKMVRSGQSWQGNPHLPASYFAFGQPLMAVADAVVIEASDGLPDNPPGHGADFHPAVPVTIDNVGGNHVVLDLGDGQYAHYFHMRAGSLLVKTGDHVRRGQLIGAIGSSGDAREPHLHLEITDAVDTLRGEGLPYVIDHYTAMSDRTDQRDLRNQQLPLDGMVIDFGN